jgi:hypothetical protein
MFQHIYYTEISSILLLQISGYWNTVCVPHNSCMFQNEPFTSYMPEALFNISRFLMNETKDVHPKGVSQFAILYTLAKQARNMGAYKLARQVLEKIQSLRVPPRFQVRHQKTTILCLCHAIQGMFVIQRHSYVIHNLSTGFS